jgi:hypothetical protein
MAGLAVGSSQSRLTQIGLLATLAEVQNSRIQHIEFTFKMRQVLKDLLDVMGLCID